MTQQLNTKAFSLALGLMWSIGILFISIIALIFEGYLQNIVEFLSSIYLSYSLSFFGIIIGMIWAFIDAAIGGFVFAWLYNKLAK